MRAFVVAVAAMAVSSAAADEISDARRQAVAGRDSYWNCLAREYAQDCRNGMSGQEFTALLLGACPSERQNFRVALVNYLSLQSPSDDPGAHMATANNAIASAQKEIVTAFVNQATAPK